MCSHWYDEKTDSIYLRPVFFSQREIKYVIYGACTSPRIMCIPTHLQNVFDLSAKPGSDKKQTRALKKVETVKHPAGNLDCDELLVVSEGGDCDEEPWLVSVASKFEDRNLVHLVKCRSGSLKLNFPRYALEFEADVKDGVFHSKNFLGYWLKESQQLEDGLRDFTKYLLLESLDGKEKLIVPQGKVAVSTTRENVSIQVPDTCDMKRKFFHYDVHNRFKNFTSTSICGRLFLAAIYAGTASSLLDDRVCMTGDEHAMELVRESWTNRPLSAQESDQLKCIRGFSTRRNPALVLLCCELEHSSKQLGFLHGHDDFRGYNYKKSPPKKGTALPFVLARWLKKKKSDEKLEDDVYDEARSMYLSLHTGHSFTFANRKVLKAAEFDRIFIGIPPPNHLNVAFKQTVEIPVVSPPSSEIRNEKSEITWDDLAQIKGRVKALLVNKPGSSEMLDFPIKSNNTKLGGHVVDELEKSWKVHHSLSSVDLKIDGMPAHQAQIVILQSECSKFRSMVEKRLRQWLQRDVLNLPPDHLSVDMQAEMSNFRLQRLGSTKPVLCQRDILRMALDPEIIKMFNPFLSATAMGQVTDSILLWLELCVWEDKMFRLALLEGAELVKELRVLRTWDVKDYCPWLVFEVESQLQIRPQQFTIAREIIKNPNAILQLNMGEGKTRVILPMLILHWAYDRECAHDNQVIRIHILPQLIDEAFEHLHCYVSASVFGRHIFQLPFSRDIQLNLPNAKMMLHCIRQCQSSRGVLLVAPQHRQSLELKWHEMQAQGEGSLEICQCLQKVFDLPYLDMHDESDEVLRHNLQLIYSVGTCRGLSAMRSRHTVLHALLLQMRENDKVRDLLLREDVAVVDSAAPSDGSFSSVRLLGSEKLDTVLPELYHLLVEGIFKNPPTKLLWMKENPHVKGQPAVVQHLIDFATKLDWSSNKLMTSVGKISPDLVLVEKMNDLLALRGFLVGGVLVHCLKKRHRVDYGISRSHAKGKRIAVPYRASDTPSERSEFSQPDLTLSYTTLSYYYDGLSRKEITETFKALLLLNPSRQISEYRTWFELLNKDVMDEDERAKIDKVEKLDLSDDEKMELLSRKYKHNANVINFFLYTCIFPSEMSEFSHKLAMTAWNLTDVGPSSRVNGFSGTKDNSLLLPEQVKQRVVEDAEIMATDGKMMGLILEKCAYTILPTDEEMPTWKILLNMATRDCDHHDALIDAGALLTGVSNYDAAKYLTGRKSLGKFYKGVVFFHNDKREWCVRDFEGQEWPKYCSPLAEKDCFVIFDERRCRGADMKLKSSAAAVLTLGPNMCKDKLMQAAGRCDTTNPNTFATSSYRCFKSSTSGRTLMIFFLFIRFATFQDAKVRHGTKYPFDQRRGRGCHHFGRFISSTRGVGCC
jgi:hypothetical protein